VSGSSAPFGSFASQLPVWHQFPGPQSVSRLQVVTQRPVRLLQNWPECGAPGSVQSLFAVQKPQKPRFEQEGAPVGPSAGGPTPSSPSQAKHEPAPGPESRHTGKNSEAQACAVPEL